MERALTTLRNLFSCLQAANLKINLCKCQIFKQHLNYLGHLISEKNIQPLLDKIITIKNFALPRNIDELWHFLGLTSYYKKSIPLSADMMKPINKLLWKDTKFQWSSQCQVSFNHLKSALYKKPILKYPNITKPYIPFTYGNNNAFPSILTQTVDDTNDLRPIAYTSASFCDMQQWWSATEKLLQCISPSWSLIYT